MYTSMMNSGMKTHYIKLFIAAIIWGGALVAGRVIASHLPPLTITFLRFSLVSIFLLPVLYIKNGRLPIPSFKTALLVLLVSFSGVMVFNYFLFAGLKTVTAVRSAVIIAFTPTVTALAAGLFFRERITSLMKFGFLSALVGAVITITNGRLSLIFQERPAVGDLFLLGCVLAWTVYSLATKVTLEHMAPLTILTYASFLGAVLLFPLALREGVLHRLASQPPETWLSLLYLSIGAAGLAYLWYYQGIHAVGASRSVIFLNLEPVTAIILGILILGEELTIPVAVGAVLVFLGLILTGIKKA